MFRWLFERAMGNEGLVAQEKAGNVGDRVSDTASSSAKGVPIPGGG
jgi:hypothetical protein